MSKDELIIQLVKIAIGIICLGLVIYGYTQVIQTLNEIVSLLK